MPLSEDELIATIFAPIAGEGALGLRDDAALVSPPEGHDLVLTADALVAGVHFFADDPPASIARKALRVNLSDLAAKGAEPLGFLLTLALPDNWAEPWLRTFAAGLGEDALAYACPLLGGDTVKTPGPLTLSVSAFGAVPAGRMVRRSGARPGDLIAVTGTIGDAALGLHLRRTPPPAWADALAGEARDSLIDRYLHPQPRQALAAALRDHASAAMDVSDGLVGDLAKLLRTSGVSGTVDLDATPLSDAARAAVALDKTLKDLAVTGGDDYEIVFTATVQAMLAIMETANAVGLPVTVIGEVISGLAAPIFRDRDGPRQFVRASFRHF